MTAVEAVARRRGRGKRMTVKRACMVILDAAERDLRGSGTGMRSLPSPEAAAEIREAYRIVWRFAYGPDNPPREI